MHSHKRNLTIFLFLFIFIFSAYSTNHDASWHFDDYPNIVDNPRIHLKDIKYKNVKEALFAGYDGGQYLDSDFIVRFPCYRLL